MQNWTASARARFYRSIPTAAPVALLDVTIEPTSEDWVVMLKTQVQAPTPQSAAQSAQDNFERAAGAARLVLNSSIDLLENPSVASGPDANGMYSATISVGASATIAQKPIDAADVAAATAVNAAYGILGVHDEQEVRFALRWLDRALRAQDVYDRFVSAWIGFETATWGRGSKVTNAVAALVPTYPGRTDAQIRPVVKRIYDSRNNVFHEAALNETDIAMKTQWTIWMLSDVLEHRLGMTPRRRAETGNCFTPAPAL